MKIIIKKNKLNRTQMCVNRANREGHVLTNINVYVMLVFKTSNKIKLAK